MDRTLHLISFYELSLKNGPFCTLGVVLLSSKVSHQDLSNEEGAKHFLSLVEVYFSAAQRFLCQITHVDLLRWTSELILVFFKAACSQLWHSSETIIIKICQKRKSVLSISKYVLGSAPPCGASASLQSVKVAFFQKVRCVFQISKSPKENIPKHHSELEI